MSLAVPVIFDTGAGIFQQFVQAPTTTGKYI